MTNTRRYQLLGFGLFVTLVLTAFTYFDSGSDGEVVGEKNITKKKALKENQSKLAFLEPILATHRQTEDKRIFYTPRTDVFVAYTPPKKAVDVAAVMHSSVQPAKKLSKPIVIPVQMTQAITPPLQPNPPSLPFRYIGKLYGDDEYIVFLGFQGKNLSVKVGDTIQQSYKVETIKPPIMQLTYLPMNIQQTILIGEP